MRGGAMTLSSQSSSALSLYASWLAPQQNQTCIHRGSESIVTAHTKAHTQSVDHSLPTLNWTDLGWNLTRLLVHSMQEVLLCGVASVFTMGLCCSEKNKKEFGLHTSWTQVRGFFLWISYSMWISYVCKKSNTCISESWWNYFFELLFILV